MGRLEKFILGSLLVVPVLLFSESRMQNELYKKTTQLVTEVIGAAGILGIGCKIYNGYVNESDKTIGPTGSYSFPKS
jgi:hypothetical protein